jgi:hypothetical protein
VKLSHKEALSFQAAMVKARHAWEALYDICPVGGFTECVDESKECKHCGAPTSKPAELAATSHQQLIDSISLIKELWTFVNTTPSTSISFDVLVKLNTIKEKLESI